MRLLCRDVCVMDVPRGVCALRRKRALFQLSVCSVSAVKTVHQYQLSALIHRDHLGSECCGVSAFYSVVPNGVDRGKKK